MTRRSLVVADASLVLASLMYPGAVGSWASTVLAEHTLAAPELMPAQTTNALRKAVCARTASPEEAAIVLAEQLDAPLATIDRRLANATGARCRFFLMPVDA